MVNIKSQCRISKDQIARMSEEDIENKILTVLSKDVIDVINNESDDLVTVEIEEKDGEFECTVELALCNKSDMESSIIAVASRLLNDGFDEKYIEQLLEPLQNSWRGF